MLVRRSFLVAFVVALIFLAATAEAGVAFFQYEKVTGMTKQCVYDYLGSTYVRTISSVSLCPLTIQVEG